MGKDFIWVVFDTSTRPEYYADVHNLLAAPSGHVFRYEYRKKWIAPEALEVIGRGDSSNRHVLLVYAQWNKFQKGDPHPPADIPSTEILHVATRLGQMVLTPSPEGDNVYFDFSVSQYPAQLEEELNDILRPLIGRGSTPFNKWVAISPDVEQFEKLTRGPEDENWQQIVEKVGTLPMQFAGDIFWRARPPMARSNRPLYPTHRKHQRIEDETNITYQVTSEYEIKEGSTLGLPIVSHTPSSAPTSTTSRFVQIETTGSVGLKSDPRLDLRQYTERTVEFAATRSDEIQERPGALRLTVHSAGSSWPVGASLSLPFGVRKSRAKILVAGLLSLTALVLTGLERSVSPLSIQARVALWGGAALCGLVAALVLTGKISLPR